MNIEKFPLYLGAERLLTTVRMQMQTVRLMAAAVVILYPLILFFLYDLMITRDEHNVLVAEVKASWFAKVNRDCLIRFELDGESYEGTPARIRTNGGVERLYQATMGKLRWMLFLSVALLIPAVFILVRVIRKWAGYFGEKHLRGPRLVPEEEVREAVRKARLAVSIPVSDTVRMPVRDETMNTLISGAPGSGKTQLFSRVFENIRARNCKTICHDFKGDYVERFYDPQKDLIFNPLDRRSLPWRIFNEIGTIMDLQAVSHSLIPISVGDQKFFNDAAREVFAGLLRYAWIGKRTTNRDIWEFVSLGLDEQVELLEKAGARAARA